MLAPGAVLGANGRLFATIGANTLPDFFNEGIGFMNNGSVAMDTNTNNTFRYSGGFAINLAGALFVTITSDPSDIYINGLRISIIDNGALVVESANAASFSNGNGITAAGNLSVN